MALDRSSPTSGRGGGKLEVVDILLFDGWTLEDVPPDVVVVTVTIGVSIGGVDDWHVAKCRRGRSGSCGSWWEWCGRNEILLPVVDVVVSLLIVNTGAVGAVSTRKQLYRRCSKFLMVQRFMMIISMGWRIFVVSSIDRRCRMGGPVIWLQLPVVYDAFDSVFCPTLYPVLCIM